METKLGGREQMQKNYNFFKKLQKNARKTGWVSCAVEDTAE